MNISIMETREKLQKECDNLNRFKEILSTSNKKTKEMCSILSKFDERLSKLEDTIAPVYQETGNLQRKQANIIKSIENLDYVIKYYNITSQVDSTINAGPNLANETSLVEYLETLDKLQDAIKYFDQNNPESVVLKDLRELYDKGSENVLREYKQLLHRHTKPISPVKVYELVDEEEKENQKKSNSKQSNNTNKNVKSANEIKKKSNIIEPLPEKIEKTFKLLTNWLCTNRLENFITLYSEFKSSILERSVLGLKNHLKSSTGPLMNMNTNTIQGSPMFGRKNYQPQLKESSSNNRLTPKGIQQALKKKFQDVLLTDANLASKFHGTHFLSTASAEQKEDPPLINEKEIVCYLTCVTAFYKLVKIEIQFMDNIVPGAHKDMILSKLVLSTLNDIVDEGNSLSSRVKRFTQKHDFTLALNLFPILRHQVSMQAKFEQLFHGCTIEVQQKLKGLIAVLQTTINRTLEEFIEFIKDDNDTKVPKDGTVHELTSNIMVFVAQLHPYIDILNRVISLPDMQCIDNTTDTNLIAYAQYIYRVLAALSLTLNKKNLQYSDPYLKAIFMLNNYHYILKSLRKNGLLDIVHLYNNSVECYYEDHILENKRIYSQSWSRVLNYVLELDTNNKPVLANETSGHLTLANMRLKDKDKRYIKDKFSGFNKEVEEIRQKQKSYAIPDAELCNKLKKDNKEFIVPKYTKFYNTYCYLDFSKNPQKYLKYNPEDLAKIIDTFFDSTA